MATTTAPQSGEATNVAMLQVPTLQWALKRTLLGLIILFVTIASAATLLYASIEEEVPGGPAGAVEDPVSSKTLRCKGLRPPSATSDPSGRDARRATRREPNFSRNST